MKSILINFRENKFNRMVRMQQFNLSVSRIWIATIREFN